MKTLLTIFFLFLSTSVFAECVSGDCGYGYGTYVWYNGDKYVGEWNNGRINGQGTYTYADGYKYVGEWKDNFLEGLGIVIVETGEQEGEKYVGEWKNGRINGQGTFTYANGTTETGIWKNFVLVTPNNITTDEKRIAKNLEIAEEKRIAKIAEIAEEKRRAENVEIAEEKRRAEIVEIAEEKRRAEIVEKEKRIAEEKRRAENVKKLLCQENGGKYFSELKSLSGKTFIDACADIFIENWFDYFGWGLSTSTKRDLNLKKGKIIYLDLGVDKINSKNDSDYINGGKLEVYNWFQFFGNNAYEARVICSMNDEDADQYVDNGMTKLKGAELFGIFGGYSAGYDGGLIIKECHIVGDDGMSF